MLARLVFGIGVLLLTTCGTADDPARKVVADAPYPGTYLAWSDEFDGDAVDSSKWKFLLGTGYNNDGSGWGNNELQYYRRENTTVENGHLVITAKRDSFENRGYTSSRLTTNDRHEFAFGRVDVRAKLPIGQGIWPAIWALGADFPDKTGWPRAGEIDIMEYLGHQPNRIYGTVHYGASGGDNYRYTTDTLIVEENTTPFHDDFHIYSIDWRPDSLSWLVDGQAFASFTAADAAAAGQPYPFNDPQYLLLNLAVGGNWPGNPDSTTVFPQQMLVDYVRIYQLQPE